MSDPSEHGREFYDLGPDVQSEIHLVSGLVVNPGDTLVVAMGDIDPEEGRHFGALLQARLPGVSVTVLSNVVEMAVVRGPGLDVPARPLVELPEGEVIRIRVTNPPGVIR